MKVNTRTKPAAQERNASEIARTAALAVAPVIRDHFDKAEFRRTGELVAYLTVEQIKDAAALPRTMVELGIGLLVDQGHLALTLSPDGPNGVHGFTARRDRRAAS
jgi:hypothetical protein